MNVLVLGAGYAGVNAYYALRGKATLITDSSTFKFYTAYLRNLLRVTPYISKLPKGAVIERINDLDLKGKWIIVGGRKVQADKMVIALGCRRPRLDQLLRELRSSNRPSLGVEYNYDEYIAIQALLYLRQRGLEVKYCGSPLSWLGEEVSKVVDDSLSEVGVRVGESCEFQLTAPEPHELIGRFLSPGPSLEVEPGVYVAGDLLEGPKLGELAMRMGTVAGLNASGRAKVLKPIFINILDFGKFGLHIRSDVPWGGTYVSVKKSPIRRLMKRFIEKYYLWRKGRMGILSFL
ncbi:hypothetical protein HS1genome_0680 [Sulfodiicoccus acidiphilus]|uniref:Pyridine nucleotide-disulfide oxidoreductase n=1 Tax=Sulfodiicoccus acidiphilus TaxID=1670455 RepID=A0A348B289_9CREN|nr:FAD/NAD(P)-binding oxidoreductase [Sulfodiicoccus acidiphilus]BBD72291.1 hypothetical protein HS1genome_0680 [Sulfodiicoccus acidiphilus]GGT90498.1 hypothetical protein GCM10007116_05400 [Sulfodiicoccus acidiphilus]